MLDIRVTVFEIHTPPAKALEKPIIFCFVFCFFFFSFFFIQILFWYIDFQNNDPLELWTFWIMIIFFLWANDIQEYKKKKKKERKRKSTLLEQLSIP